MFNNKRNLSILRTPLILLALLALGILMVLVLKLIAGIDTGTIITALLVPLLAYLLLSGAIAEIGVGGWTAKFTRVASAEITVTTEITLSEFVTLIPSARDFDIVGAEGDAALEKILSTYKLNIAESIVLCFRLGKDEYPRIGTSLFIKYLSSYHSFKFIVFLDQYDRVQAYMPFWDAMQLLTDEREGERFIFFVNDNQVQEILKLPRVVTEPLSMQSTNAEALRQMMNLNLDALLVVDVYGQLKGVVERDEVVSRMMLTLVDKSTT